ncbi:hypothetical protein B0H10DRAFT_1220341 [Mycena sp. CBHHK59/15]|nr:hypothetical protein B0H10DRAFT_1220341 [Mycena sp. CBHHK59/15]
MRRAFIAATDAEQPQTVRRGSAALPAAAPRRRPHAARRRPFLRRRSSPTHRRSTPPRAYPPNPHSTHPRLCATPPPQTCARPRSPRPPTCRPCTCTAAPSHTPTPTPHKRRSTRSAGRTTARCPTLLPCTPTPIRHRVCAHKRTTRKRDRRKNARSERGRSRRTRFRSPSRRRCAARSLASAGWVGEEHRERDGLVRAHTYSARGGERYTSGRAGGGSAVRVVG